MKEPVTFIASRDEGEPSILWVIGELDDFTVATFEAELERLAAAGRPVVIELSSCTFISSCALHMLVRLRRQHPGRTLALVSASAHVAKLLRIAGLEPLLPRFENVVDALDRVSGPGARAALSRRTVVTGRPAGAAHLRELRLVDGR